MLVELVVNNYAVIEHLRVRFHRGLNLLTGETGSGKSIVVDALALLFGGRASADMIRTGADRARISGIFEVPDEEEFSAILAGAGIETEDGELLIEREILASGKSRAFAGSRPATAALLRKFAPLLGDIHGQHEQQRLFSPEAQLEMLDAFAGNQELLARTASVYRQWKAAGEELERLETSEKERLRLADLWAFQLKEIDSAALQPGEDTALENERRVLQNVARLEANISAAYQALYEAADSALARIRQARRALEEICAIDESLAPLRDSLPPAEITVEETAHELRHYLGRLEADPARLEEIESRLATLEKLKRKYGSTIEEILRYLEQVRANLASSESAEQRRAALQQERERLAEAFRAQAARLTGRRQEAARRLEKRLEEELRSLAMEGTRFRIRLEPAPWSARGADRVVYLVSPNPGEEPRPLEKVASGGELSRIALALKTCTTVSSRSAAARGRGPRTLVFDEIDSGVGGRAAETLGRRLKRLAAGSQVLCVTHLPQIAGFADHHYLVSKREVRGRSVAAIKELTGEARTREIGRMLSGRRLTEEAVRQAEQLIKMASD